MIVRQAFRYELDPHDRQRTLLAKHAGVARFAWNWALARRIEQFHNKSGKQRFTSAITQHKELCALKKTEFPWMYDVSKCAPQEALRELDKAFKNFWRARKAGRRHGFPKFCKKGADDRFRFTGSIRIKGSRHVVLPRIGTIRVKEDTRKFDGRILSATVSRQADRWFVSLCVERERPDPKPVQGPIVGVDLGLNFFAVLSDGTRIKPLKALAANLRRLRRLCRAHSRKQKGSNNRQKSAIRLARLYRKIRNIRTDASHKLTTWLAKTKSTIVIEDVSVRRMIRNRRLSRSIADAGWAEFRRQLAYKTRWYGSELVVAPRSFPSTRRCSSCGTLGPRRDLSCRVFRCNVCGFTLDRDENAARNVAWYGQFGRNQHACGELSVGGTGTSARSTRHGSMKQEATAIWAMSRMGKFCGTEPVG